MEPAISPRVSDGGTRRDFIKKTAAAAAALATTPLLRTPVYGQSQAPSAGRVVGANDRLVLGFIGVGGQGMTHVRLLKDHLAANNIAQAAVADLWTKRREEACQVAGGDCQAYADFRKLLDRKDIDAVVIATHDPIHATAALAALEAGKHVYVEKPLTRYLGEAFAVHDAVKRTGKILQVGTQGCSAAAWTKAAEMIRAGKIGTLVWGQGYYCRNSVKGEWNYGIDPSCTADNTDWEAWQGPVHNRIPFDADHFFRWRKYYPYCAGLLGDLFPHRLNPLMLATGNPEFPVRVVSIGTKNVHSDRNTPGTPERDVPEHISVLAEFPSGATLVIGASTVNAKSPGFVLYGHQATLEIGTSGEKLQLLPEKEFADEIDPETLDGLTPAEDIAVHEKNWLECIRSNQPPTANIDLAVRAQTVVSLAEMSDRLDMACLFDEKTRTISTAGGQKVAAITYGTLPLS
jgi:predicted dehydrogenase